MRTKAEAIAGPLAGDRWREPNGDIKTITILRNNEVVWRREKRVQYIDGRVRRFTSFPSTWTSFRKWAATAEFLGGAE